MPLKFFCSFNFFSFQPYCEVNHRFVGKYFYNIHSRLMLSHSTNIFITQGLLKGGLKQLICMPSSQVKHLIMLMLRYPQPWVQTLLLQAPEHPTQHHWRFYVLQMFCIWRFYHCDVSSHSVSHYGNTLFIASNPTPQVNIPLLILDSRNQQQRFV